MNNYLWYALPLVLAVSLVYAATRHEKMGPILRHALWYALWILAFMGILFVILLGLWWLEDR
jgi:hypothetical protein